MKVVEHFVELHFTNKETLNLLAHQQHIVISIRTLKIICKKMHFFRTKNQADLEEIAAFVEEEMAGSAVFIGGCISGPLAIFNNGFILVIYSRLFIF